METTSVLALAFGVGVIAGLRSFTAPMVVSWAAHQRWLHLQDTWMAFLGYAATPYVITALALAELVNDKLPKTPSRKAAGPFAGRILFGAFSGASALRRGTAISRRRSFAWRFGRCGGDTGRL